MPGERLATIGRKGGEEQRKDGRGRGGKRRSVRAEEASPGLDLRVMITPADCISEPDCSHRAGSDAPASCSQFSPGCCCKIFSVAYNRLFLTTQQQQIPFICNDTIYFIVPVGKFVLYSNAVLITVPKLSPIVVVSCSPIICIVIAEVHQGALADVFKALLKNVVTQHAIILLEMSDSSMEGVDPTRAR